MSDIQVIEMNGKPVKVARFDGDLWIELDSGANVVGKQKDHLLRMNWKTFKGEKYVPLDEYVDFIQQEAVNADNFEARALLQQVTSMGMKHLTQDGILTLPTGEQIQAIEKDGQTYYDFDALCKALEIPREEAESILKLVRERGY